MRRQEIKNQQLTNTTMTTITVNSSIFANINCKGGIALLCGQVVKETEKAIQIHYTVEPIFVGNTGVAKTYYNRQAWVPKSQVVADGRGAFEIKGWFANKAMKGFNIKPYAA
jgi:hypothetical protein